MLAVIEAPATFLFQSLVKQMFVVIAYKIKIKISILPNWCINLYFSTFYLLVESKY